ncbi:MAG: DUF748 domain-containing protein [Pricia sp.]|nr:DUF748 domain-containing protein [Pricia sp.]
MALKRKSLFYILVPLVLVLFYFGLQWWAKASLEDFLERKLPNHISLLYEQVDINILKGSISFTKPDIQIFGKHQDSLVLMLHAKSVDLENLKYWKLINSDEIHLDGLVVSHPDITLYQPDTTQKNKDRVIGLLKPILIENVEITNANLKRIDSSKDTVLSLDSLFVQISKWETNADLINKKLPFTYGPFELGFENLFFKVGEYENLVVDKFHVEDKQLEIKNIRLWTKHSRSELSQLISVERDHVDLTVPEFTLSKVEVGYARDSVFLNTESGLIKGLKLDIYRDKNLPDDLNAKILYGKLLKDLPFKIALRKLEIDASEVVYEEAVRSRNNAGLLKFEELAGTIKHISNLENEKNDLEISLTSQLMGDGKLELNWSFNVQDPEQRFIASGSVGNLNTATLNNFLRPNLRVSVEGEIQKMYFTISGDQFVTNGDVKMRYEDFKFQVLDKEEAKIKKILTFLGNLFVSDGSKADEEGYRYGNINNVQRNTNKSFFNYLWISLQDGILDVLSGDGKKD